MARAVTEELIREHVATLDHEPRIVIGGNASVPWALTGLVDRVVERYRLFMLNAPRGIPSRDGVIHETPFVGPGMRGTASLSYIPARLSQVPLLFATTRPPDIVCVHTSRPERGKVSLGAEVNVLPAAIEAAKDRGALVLAQVNSHMPFTFGDAEVSLDQVDAVLEADEPLGEVPARRVATAEGATEGGSRDLDVIGRSVAARVVDGATLQLGIGELPDAVLRGLLDREGLAVWSEMISDGILSLEAAHAMDPGRLLVVSFLVGSRQLYHWADHNVHLRVLRTETVNDPGRIARNDHMVSINTALEIDLFGQANASRINGRIHSGFGGQTDFVVGALHATGGQALMALRSWHPRADVSTIVPLIDEPVTSFQHSAVITEQGVATIWGNDERGQARELIECAAHPRVRTELWEEAVALGLAE